MTDSATTGKRTWHPPQLTVLARGNPEEATLAGCKNSYNATGAGTLYLYCLQATSCMMCSEYASS
jgi:hypothetical protein